MTPHQGIRPIKLGWLRDECLALDREHDGFRGVVVVARAVGAGGMPGVFSRLWDADLNAHGRQGAGGHYIRTPFHRPDNPGDDPAVVLGDLTGEDLQIGIVGRGYSEFAELAQRVADLGVSVPAAGRFGDLSRDARHEAAERLIVFLASYAIRTVNGSAFPARIEGFDDEGFRPVPASRAATLDPRGQAYGQPYAVIIQQGLFSALWEVLYRAAAISAGPPSPCGSGSSPDLVTLREVSPYSRIKKSSLEIYKRKKGRQMLPNPVIARGGGRSDLYSWKEMRAWIAENLKVPLDQLPEFHPLAVEPMGS